MASTEVAKKRDPDGGQVFTFEELRKKYQDEKEVIEIQEYWDSTCVREHIDLEETRVDAMLDYKQVTFTEMRQLLFLDSKKIASEEELYKHWAEIPVPPVKCPPQQASSLNCLCSGRTEKNGASKASAAAPEEGPLFTAFTKALDSMEPNVSELARKYVEKERVNVTRVLNLFKPDGNLASGIVPASCYNDLYKWTMFPVVTTVEKGCKGDVRCTFSVNIRDVDYRKQLYDSASGKTSPELYKSMKASLEGLLQREFDRDAWSWCIDKCKIPGWDQTVLDSVCGPEGTPRMLIQEFKADQGSNVPSKPGNVLVDCYVAHDEKLQEERVYIEATGPWHRVTWLETSMMQCVYDVLLRDRKRQEYGTSDDGDWYPKWLAEAFCRCTRSVAAAVESGLKGALFTGRRTGGLSLMMIQGMYTQAAFKTSEGQSMMLGSSSVTACYYSLQAGVPAELVPAPAGTHAHELSMVISAILGEVDDKAGMPLAQVIGHILYFYKSRPQGDVKEVARRALMPMLPDTLGTNAFMKTASKLKVPVGAHMGDTVLSVIGAARQDSGSLEQFKQICEQFDFKGPLMASEIETADDLFKARDNGYKLFGAGGYMGDSEKAWDKSKANISMACKVLRVYVEGTKVKSEYTPTKTGETSQSGMIKEGKFEADGHLSAAEIAALKARAQLLADATPKLSDEELQALFVETLGRFELQPQTESSSCAVA